jgi:hypothetical protein
VNAVLNPSTGSISGRVLVAGAAGASPTPISAADGVVVTLRSTAVNRTLRPVDLPLGRKGEFRFDNVPPAAYTLTVTRSGSTPQTFLVNTTSTASFSSALGDIVMDRPAQITGRVRPFATFPGLRRYAIEVYTPEAIGVPVIPRATTDDNGNFTLSGMFAPARYVVRFEDLETGETFTLPNASQTTTDGSDIINLEPGFPFDMNEELAGEGETIFFPFSTFDVRTSGTVTVATSAPTTCTLATAGDLYVEAQPGDKDGTLRFCNGEAWVSGPEVRVVDAQSGQLGEQTFIAPPAPHGPAARLDFAVQPTTVTWSAATGSATLTTTVTVRILDEQDKQVTTGPLAQSTITLAPSDPALGLSGTTFVEAKAGQAVFTDLRVLRAGNAIRLLVSGGGLPTVQSNAFNVNSIAPAAPSLVILDSGPVVNWGVPFSDGGRDISHYFVVAQGSTASYSLTACTGEAGPAPSVPSAIQGLGQPVFYRRVPGPLSCGFTAPLGSPVRFRVYAVSTSGQVSPASSLTSGSLP